MYNGLQNPQLGSQSSTFGSHYLQSLELLSSFEPRLKVGDGFRANYGPKGTDDIPRFDKGLNRSRGRALGEAAVRTE
jgi:hypothetical protein